MRVVYASYDDHTHTHTRTLIDNRFIHPKILLKSCRRGTVGVFLHLTSLCCRIQSTKVSLELTGLSLRSLWQVIPKDDSGDQASSLCCK
jgi:hypothetical protein